MTCKRKRLGAQEVMVFEYHRQVKQIQVNSTIITTIYNCKCVLWIPLFPLKKTNYTHSQFNILIVCDNVDTCVCVCVYSAQTVFQHGRGTVSYCQVAVLNMLPPTFVTVCSTMSCYIYLML